MDAEADHVRFHPFWPMGYTVVPDGDSEAQLADQLAQQDAAKILRQNGRIVFIGRLMLTAVPVAPVIGWLTDHLWIGLGAAVVSGAAVYLLNIQNMRLGAELGRLDHEHGIPVPTDQRDNIVSMSAPIRTAIDVAASRRDKPVGAGGIDRRDPGLQKLEEAVEGFLDVGHKMRAAWLKGDQERWRALPNEMRAVADRVRPVAEAFVSRFEGPRSL